MQKTVQKKRKSSKETNQNFEAVAKRLGADEDKGRFEAKLRKIAKAKRARQVSR